MRITSGSVRETLHLGKSIGRCAAAGDIICLFGSLGSGKTVLAKGIAEGLGIQKHDVLSPTFVLMRQYDGRLAMYHFDLYRLQDISQVRDLGYEEYFFDNGVTVIEWPERLGSLMPDSYLKITLDVAGKSRRLITIAAKGQRNKGALRAINEDILS